MAICNSTLEDAYINETPLWKGVTFHHFGLLLAAIFGLISVVISLFLIWRHATHYLVPGEQKHIIRILFMVPVYSVVSFLSYLYYRHAVYFDVLRDCYEAFAISSFFALLCHYVAPTLHDQKEYFRGVVPVNWFWGVFGLQKCTGGKDKGILRRPRSGLTWFNVIWVGIFQYCFIRVFFTIVSVITEAFDKYCEASLSPAFAHIWVLAFECLSVTIAMFMVVQFYIQLKADLAEHRPFLKVLSIKLVIFFSFWQTIVISLLSSDTVGVLKPTDRLAFSDIQIGIPSVLLCIEMAAFSVMHMFAYPWKPYSLKHNAKLATTPTHNGEISRYSGGFMGWKAILDAFNPWDIITASARGFRWLFVGVRKRHNDPSYMPANKLADQTTGYGGPSFAATGDAATELQGPRRSRANTYGHGEDDSSVLLGDAQLPAKVHAEGHDDLRRHQPPLAQQPSRALEPYELDMKPSEWSDVDTGYHPGMGPPPGTTIPVGQAGGVHPKHRGQSPQPPQQGTGWNVWGGVQGEQQPPAYGSNDKPYR
ncbi:Putative organic solute transporter subunit alpha/Transmembrane protein [Septoria linicola]|uniref:Organic solute transporter subunit alpha/Transmembrane protein n=1 Tax=Septoria linicola TaxID=215465 RepID=A0A9Q9AQ69_9PEZI|nr:putative organic solute transporter subunit alpha/Transmembrane protein [Septoria linicola]USW52464.1 Putative organic solute transporter subunit alpha/Transmembrane protein [Septoria linicola]